jgi:uncharacterized protein YjbJ (UPF0337 family)
MGVLPKWNVGATSYYPAPNASVRCHLRNPLNRQFRSVAKGEVSMNWEQIEGNWIQFKGKLRQQWGKFSEDELDTVKGKREQFIGKLQEKYGIVKEKAEKELDEFLRKLH